MKPMNDNDPSRLAEYELPEWLQREQDEQRQREAEGRCMIGVICLIVVLCGLIAMNAIYKYAGGLG